VSFLQIVGSFIPFRCEIFACFFMYSR